MDKPELIKYLDSIIYSEPGKKKKRYIKVGLFKCSCGKEFSARTQDVNREKIKSCGCFPRGKTTHGKTGTSVYNAWLSMKSRCYRISDTEYHNYGGRGITVCEEWKDSFEQFYKDMGDKPSEKHSLDRIEVNEGYKPGNCRWATSKEQGKNKRNNIRIKFKGRDMILSEWSRETGIIEDTLKYRLSKNWKLEDIFRKT